MQAYTCSLDIYNEYVNCANDKRRLSASGAGGSNSHNNTLPQQANSNYSEKNSGLMKKLIYGRNKASSSGDMSKSLKPINGLSKLMINGIQSIEKLTLSSGNNNNNNSSSNNSNNGSNNLNSNSIPTTPPKTVCQSANCCGIYVKNFTSIVENHHNSMNSNDQHPPIIHENGLLTNEKDASTNRSSSNENGYHNHHNNSTNTKPTLNSLNQKIWYMCDDDKIKMMPQREFEELLSRNQKVMITPYLLFYARYDMQNTKETASD